MLTRWTPRVEHPEGWQETAQTYAWNKQSSLTLLLKPRDSQWKKNHSQKRQIKVPLKAICIFKSKANDYQLKLIADEAYIAPLPHPKFSCNQKKKNQYKNSGALE